MSKKPIPVKEIVTQYLKANGYDGLFNPNECGCMIGDLFPCGCCDGSCLPGYKGPDLLDKDIDWRIYARKEDIKDYQQILKTEKS